MRPCEGNADFCVFAADYPRDIVPDPRFQATRFSFLCKHVFNPLVQSASLIKGKIFSSGSFDSSVNDVHGTKRFNIGGFGERKERACKVRPPRNIGFDMMMNTVLNKMLRCGEISSTLKRRATAREITCSSSTRTLSVRLLRFQKIDLIILFSFRDSVSVNGKNRPSGLGM